MASTMSPMPTTQATTGQSAHDAAHDHRAYIGMIHGVLMLIAFGILFPLGGAVLRGLTGRYTARLHGIWQVVAYGLAIAGMGTGLYCSSTGGYGTFTSKNGHKQIGMVVFVIMTIMPVIGVIHHERFKKQQRLTQDLEHPKNNFLSKLTFGLAHRWVGRAAVLMGCINIGLGLMLGRTPERRILAYSVVTAVCGTIYVVFTLMYGPETKDCAEKVRTAPNTPRQGSLDTATSADDIEMKEPNVRANAA